MKPAPFDYHDPATVAEVVELLDEHGDDAAVLAGGQSLVPLLNLRLAVPGVVIDLRRVDALSSMHGDTSGLEIGATVTARALGAHPGRTICGEGLGQALSHIGHPQIRNRTTIGGSIAHADPAAELPALLLALDGSVTLTSRRDGDRGIAARDFFDGAYSTTRRPDELLVSVHLPACPGRSTTVEVARRPGDFALVGAVVVAGATTRISLFGVSNRPVRVPEAEAAASAGAPLEDVAAAVRASIEPRDDLHASGAYRSHVAGTIVSRALERLGAASP